MKDQDEVEFEELLQFHDDGINADQNGDGNLEQTNFDFDVIGDVGFQIRDLLLYQLLIMNKTLLNNLKMLMIERLVLKMRKKFKFQ